MMTRKYHNKEIKIFEAVFNLAKSGVDMDTLRVQKIAEVSTIAKGTLYEYFDSKEAIIYQTIVYYLYQEAKWFQDLLKTSHSFVELIECTMDKMKENKKVYSSFEVLFKYSSNQQREFFEIMMPYVINYLNDLIAIGKREGIIDNSIEDSYARHILVAGFSSYSITGSFKVKDNKIAKQQSIKLMLHCLA